MSRKDERDPSKPTAELQARVVRASVPEEAADPKKVILARRASFIAAAMVGIACGKTTNDPPPMPCLSVAWVPEDAGAPAQGDAEATSNPDGGATAADADNLDAGTAKGASGAVDGGRMQARPPQPVPAPCLSVGPRPCLTPPLPPLKTPSKQ